ncbi:MAG: DoxX family membrane protein, partial [Muribaculaceae bacterium]|nr:DoxX family membrane protein [Muribaculaceae bacterium]
MWILRLAVGGIFIVSGAAKMIDLYGFIYKINDYLAAWHLSVSKGPVVFTAALLSATEFLTGITLA